MPEYQVYDWSFSMPCHMEGPFPMPCHMADSRQDGSYVNFYIPVTYIYISIQFFLHSLLLIVKLRTHRLMTRMSYCQDSRGMCQILR